MLRIVLIVIGAAVALAAVVGAGFTTYFFRYYSPIPVADFPAPENELEARQQDLEHLLRLTEFDRSFSSAELRQFENHVEELQGNVQTLTDAEFAMGVAAAAAITENGHTNVSLRDVVNGLNSLPVRFFWFGDGLHIVRARDSHADLIGARVVSYGDTPPEALVARLDPYFGGNYEFLQFQSPTFFAAPAAMHAVGLIPQPDRVALTLQAADGSMRDVVIDAEAQATPAMRVSAHAMPIPSEIETESANRWVFLGFPTIDAPHYARNADTQFWSETLPGGGHYLRLKWIMNDEDRSLTEWLEAQASALRAEPVDYLVIDVRSNGGGDLTLAMKFARNITDLLTPDGHVYILTDGGTFSAAIVTAAYALSDADERASVVGVHVGDDEQFWAEGGGVLTLPNSGLSISVSTGYHDWENGCSDWGKCYWLAAALGVAAGPLDPDINAPLTYADYSRGIDTGLEAILEAEGVGTEPPPSPVF